MGNEDNHRIDRVTAEQLLDGTATIRGEIADLLAMAAAPARSGELAGEEAAAAMFRAVGPTPGHRPFRRAGLMTRLAGLLAVKIAAGLLVIGAGGVALAASSGVLPNPLGRHVSTPNDGRAHVTGRPTPSRTTPSNSTRPSSRPSTSPSGTAAFHGLCTAYLAGIRTGHPKKLDNPAFAALVTAAGGKDGVEAYCSELLAVSPGPSGSPPGNAHHPHPTHKPTDHPSGKPSSHPGPHSGG